MANCPFCSDTLLRHFRGGQSYWFCRRCRSEIFDPKSTQTTHLQGGCEKMAEETPSLLSQSYSVLQLNEPFQKP